MAYECSPWGTSERAVGWGRMLQAARVAETHVVTSERNYGLLVEAQAEGGLPAGVKVYTPKPDAKLRRLEKKAVLFAYNYTAYRHWQRLAMKLARELQEREGFDLVHQVNVCTFREPGYTWQLGIPYVWGPVGGTQNFPVRFLTMLGAKEAFKEAARGVSNWLSLRMKPRVKAAAKAAVTVYGANSTNQVDYARVFGREVELLLETGLYEVQEPDRGRFEERVTTQREGRAPEPVRLLWIGELHTRKALPILLRALVEVRGSVRFELKVLGAGPMRAPWEREAERLGLAGQVEFRGVRPFAEVQAELEQAHVFCFTSLRDTSGNVVLEALAAGVPVVCFDHQGARDMVSETSGAKIAVSSPKQAVGEWARVLRELYLDAERMLRLSEGATEQARRFLWERNGDRVNALYRRVAGEEAGTGAGGVVGETMKR